MILELKYLIRKKFKQAISYMFLMIQHQLMDQNQHRPVKIEMSMDRVYYILLVPELMVAML